MYTIYIVYRLIAILLCPKCFEKNAAFLWAKTNGRFYGLKKRAFLWAENNGRKTTRARASEKTDAKQQVHGAPKKRAEKHVRGRR
jgi:hypothetical protein